MQSQQSDIFINVNGSNQVKTFHEYTVKCARYLLKRIEKRLYQRIVHTRALTLERQHKALFMVRKEQECQLKEKNNGDDIIAGNRSANDKNKHKEVF